MCLFMYDRWRKTLLEGFDCMQRLTLMFPPLSGSNTRARKFPFFLKHKFWSLKSSTSTGDWWCHVWETVMCLFIISWQLADETIIVMDRRNVNENNSKLQAEKCPALNIVTSDVSWFNLLWRRIEKRSWNHWYSCIKWSINWLIDKYVHSIDSFSCVCSWWYGSDSHQRWLDALCMYDFTHWHSWTYQAHIHLWDGHSNYT